MPCWGVLCHGREYATSAAIGLLELLPGGDGAHVLEQRCREARNGDNVGVPIIVIREAMSMGSAVGTTRVVVPRNEWGYLVDRSEKVRCGRWGMLTLWAADCRERAICRDGLR